MVLLGELLDDDIADLVLDLLARHLVERLEVDDIDQPLVKLDLELGLRVALGERTRIADRDDAMLVERALPVLLDFGFGPDCLANLPHHTLSRPSAAATPASIPSRSLAIALLRLISSIGTPRSIAVRISAKSLLTV
jgi:hypothetical protein